MIITIDGPTASGKSTIAGVLARHLHYYHINSGLLYRSLAYLLVTELKYTEKLLHSVKQEAIEYCMNSEKFLYEYDVSTGTISIFYMKKNITHFLKDASVDYSVAIISPQKLVREAMVKEQHSLAKKHNIVTDGRDVGSHVFPDADYKFYLTASLQVRAERWQKDQEKRGNNFSLQEAELAISDRDLKDQTRKISPLIIPEGALVVDSSDLSIQETIDRMLACIKQ